MYFKYLYYDTSLQIRELSQLYFCYTWAFILKSTTDATNGNGNYFLWGRASEIRRSDWLIPTTASTTSDLTLVACSTSLSPSSFMLACTALCVVV